MVKRPLLHPTLLRAGALGAVVVVGAVAATNLHRNGHTQGDDFALYLRQARSLFEGDAGKVISDNRFAVLNSDSSFSPIGYPWGWPLLLAPFVHLWGLDYDRLKILEVAIFCLWLVMLHGIVRRRLGRLTALGVIAVLATAQPFLVHTDELLTEFPHLAALTIFIWWYDRIRQRSPLHQARNRDLVVLGVLVTVTFNIRREGIVLVGVIAAMQGFELLNVARVARGLAVDRLRALIGAVQTHWRKILLPYAAFAASAALFQLLLPTTVLPDNGDSRKYLQERLGDYPGVLTGQLGIGRHPAIGVLIVCIALIGVVIGIRRRPALDGPIALLGFISAIAISTHFRLIDRYWLQVTPWIIYFVAVAAVELFGFVIRRRRWIARSLAALPLLYLVVVHTAVLPGVISDAHEFNDSGRVQFGPADPGVIPIYDAVRTMTPPTAVIAFARARTMTLLTDRLSLQTTNVDKVLERADYFAQRRNSHYWQPDLTMSEAREKGFELVWSDARWILWKVTTHDVHD
jgi:hypothetical protein